MVLLLLILNKQMLAGIRLRILGGEKTLCPVSLPEIKLWQQR